MSGSLWLRSPIFLTSLSVITYTGYCFVTPVCVFIVSPIFLTSLSVITYTGYCFVTPVCVFIVSNVSVGNHMRWLLFCHTSVCFRHFIRSLGEVSGSLWLRSPIFLTSLSVITYIGYCFVTPVYVFIVSPGYRAIVELLTVLMWKSIHGFGVSGSIPWSFPDVFVGNSKRRVMFRHYSSLLSSLHLPNC